MAETGINAINRYMHALTKLGKETKSGKFITENLIGYDLLSQFWISKDEHSGELKFNVGKIEFTEENEILMIDMRIPVTYDKEK